MLLEQLAVLAVCVLVSIPDMPDMPDVEEPDMFDMFDMFDMDPEDPPLVLAAAAGYVAARRKAQKAPTPAVRVRDGKRRNAWTTGATQLPGSGTTRGTMANASSATKGPVFGSVPDPVKIPPRPWPVSQNTIDTTKPRARKGSIASEEQRADSDHEG